MRTQQEALSLAKSYLFDPWNSLNCPYEMIAEDIEGFSFLGEADARDLIFFDVAHGPLVFGEDMPPLEAIAPVKPEGDAKKAALKALGSLGLSAQSGHIRFDQIFIVEMDDGTTVIDHKMNLYG